MSPIHEPPPQEKSGGDWYLQMDSMFSTVHKFGMTGDAAMDKEARLAREKEFLKEFFHKEPCPYTHRIFRFAGLVFETLKHEVANEDPYSMMRGTPYEEEPKKSFDIPHIDFEAEQEKRLTFELAFATLKYQPLLEGLIEDCHFFLMYPEFKEDVGVVMVLLYDFQNRKFQKRRTGKKEYIDPYMAKMEGAMVACRTKLNASLARSRIKHCALSIDHLLPENVRMKDQLSSDMFIFTWVNQIKMSIHEVLEKFKAEEFTLVTQESNLVGRCMMIDYHCPDVIVFHGEERSFLQNHILTENGSLVIQDKSSFLGIASARALLNDGDDIIHINIGSGLISAHLASVCHPSDTNILGFGISSDQHLKDIQKRLDHLGATKNVKLITDSFLDCEPDDPRLKYIKVMLITAECSRSGVTNPVDYIVNEGEDMSILRDLSVDGVDDSKLGELIAKHTTVLKHALKFARIQAVVYMTRSVHEAENESVVNKAIEYTNVVQQKRTPFRVAPPVIPMCEEDINAESFQDGKFLKFQPSPSMSGCFVAIILREAEDPKEAAKDILARAAAKGLLGGGPAKPEKPEKSKSSGDRPKARNKKTAPKKSKSSPAAAAGGGKKEKKKGEDGIEAVPEEDEGEGDAAKKAKPAAVPEHAKAVAATAVFSSKVQETSEEVKPK